MRRFFRLMVAAALALTLAGCEFRDLDLVYEEYAEITVIADWSKAGIDPNGMTVAIFPADGSKNTVIISHSDTVVCNMPAGGYNIIVMNETYDDFDFIRFEDTDDFYNLNAICKNTTTLRDGTSYVDSPDILAVKSYEMFLVSDAMVDATRSRTRTKTRTRTRTTKAGDDDYSPDEYIYTQMTIHAVPEKLVYPVHVSVTVDGISSISSAGSFINGFATGVNLATGTPLTSEAAHKVTFTSREFVQGSETRGILRGDFTSFGFKNGNTKSFEDYTLDFRSVLIDGSDYQETRSLENRISQKKSGGDISIEIAITSEWPVRVPIVKGTGMWEVDVEDWQEQIIPIDM